MEIMVPDTCAVFADMLPNFHQCTARLFIQRAASQNFYLLPIRLLE